MIATLAPSPASAVALAVEPGEALVPAVAALLVKSV
jgi:hypothetical protein